MQLAVADPQFSAQAVTEAVSKARRGIMEYAGSVYFTHEQLRGCIVLGKNAFGMARAIMIDVFDSFVNVTHDPDRNFQVSVFGMPVFFCSRNDLLVRKHLNGVHTATDFYCG